MAKSTAKHDAIDEVIEYHAEPAGVTEHQKVARRCESVELQQSHKCQQKSVDSVPVRNEV
jgi:hypothetical protein